MEDKKKEKTIEEIVWIRTTAKQPRVLRGAEFISIHDKYCFLCRKRKDIFAFNFFTNSQIPVCHLCIIESMSDLIKQRSKEKD